MLKRKLAALLAGAMVLTSLPMVSFAASDNRVDKVPTIKKDTLVSPVPELVIEQKSGDIISFATGSEDTITLSFENAEFQGPTIADNSANKNLTFSGVSNIVYTAYTNKLVEIKFVGAASSYRIPMHVKVPDAGEAKVTIDPMESPVSAGTYVIAVAGSGATKTTIEGTRDFTDTLSVKPIIIEELKVNTIERNTKRTITLEAPKGFEFKTATANLIPAGGFTVLDTTSAAVYSSSSSSSNVGYSTYANDTKTDKEVLKINYRITGANNSRGRILIEGLQLVATDDAELGDVSIKVSGDNLTTESVKVGKYIDYGVSVTAEDDDMKEILSGDFVSINDDAQKLLKVIIKENADSSWWSQRKTTVQFADEVKILDVEVKKADNTNLPLEKLSDTSSALDNFVKMDDHKITINGFTINAGKKAEVELLFWVSVEADYEGDITAVVGGAALPEETEVVLGKAIVPIAVKADVTDVQIGYKEVAIGAIEITEAKAGALEKGGYLWLEAESMEFNDDFKPEVEVVAGDLQIDGVKFIKNKVRIEIKRASKEASTLKITGLNVFLNRALPEGSYDLYVSGTAFLNNAEAVSNVNYEDTPNSGTKYFSTKRLVVPGFVNVVTPAPHKGEAAGAAVTASFTVGSADYTVGDQVATADAAPYIQDGRTMVPVKYVAYALGVDPQQVQWDQATKTVTIYGDKVVNITIGSKSIVVGGTPVPMDTAAVVKDGRTFVPIAFAARALGVPYKFDDATKTVTFN
jgi:hypothetical protein